jgi:membrane protease YdiL (CAAX protease family)
MFSPPAREALVVAAVVTLAVAVASRILPARWTAMAVGGTFLTATWIFVLRRDDNVVERAGLAFGGLVLPEPLDVRRIARDLGLALAWTLVLALLFFGPFFFGFRVYARWIWHAPPGPAFSFRAAAAIDEVLGQVGLVALPEEAFYRGYLQTRFDDASSARVRVFGAAIGPSILLTSAIFAVGHVLTIPEPARLAVFFPSLLFGWLRARTGGVGASIGFHACCNIFSAMLFQSYGPR